jgi:hypothetical protein
MIVTVAIDDLWYSFMVALVMVFCGVSFESKIKTEGIVSRYFARTITVKY